MLLACVKTERKKLHHSNLWVAFLLIPLLPTVMGAANYMNNLGLLKSEWYSLWTQHSLFYANFFYAPLIALYCSYIWRVEHLNYNWNHLMTMPVSAADIFLSKLLLAMRCTIVLQLWMWVLFLTAGKAVGLPGLPDVQILGWLLRGSLGAFAITALQLVLSMMIRSFAVPIALALLGSVAGLLASNGGLGLFWPYSLMLMGMNANRTEDMVSSSLGFGVSTLVFFLVFTGFGIYWLRRKDVRA
ncbi:multidrug ABC transporter permease [Lachnoclostridium sp. An131]|uniref:ABC transporter permease n=1 Tax=Lachnoclostridium sp. An131 TaxID=1965555 RepID=UPI000B36506F|nr:ABC transporter permease [Lachnoclostridium sp. An131]OUQ27303.1 multidrug ABC transporter permease [Lachnoclostridium sp. An131]